MLLIKDLNLPLDSHNSTQYGADFHNGTTNVPLAHSLQNVLMTFLAMHGGGTNQLHSYDQFCVNAFIASVPLHQHFELNLMHLLL